MLRTLLSHVPSHTTFAAYLSLFLVLTGGTAFALSGSNTVFSDDIKNGQVKSGDVGANSIGSGKVIDNSLRGSDVASLTGADVSDGSLGSADVAGLNGGDLTDDSVGGDDVDESSLAKVPQTDTVDGFDSTQLVRSGQTYMKERSTAQGVTVDIGTGDRILEHSCDQGDLLLSGGPTGLAATSNLVSSAPTNVLGSPGWQVRVDTNGEDAFTVKILCAQTAP